MFRPPYTTPMYYPTLNKLNVEEEKEDEDEYDEGECEGEGEGEVDDCDEGDEVEIEWGEGVERNHFDRLTMDLMMNHKYLAKTHPSHKIQQRQFHERILKNRKEIMKIVQECFRYLEEDDFEPLCRNHLNDGFKEFAKLALEEIEHSKLPEADQLFSEKA